VCPIYEQEKIRNLPVFTKFLTLRKTGRISTSHKPTPPAANLLASLNVNPAKNPYLDVSVFTAPGGAQPFNPLQIRAPNQMAFGSSQPATNQMTSTFANSSSTLTNPSGSCFVFLSQVCTTAFFVDFVSITAVLSPSLGICF